MCASACSNGGSVESDAYRQKMVENMKAASLWLIEEGVSTFSMKGKEGLHRKLVDQWGVQLWVDPWVETSRYHARFGIKARGIHYEILNLYRQEISGDLYEFWVVKVSGKDWSGESYRSEFFLTKTDGVCGHREIIKSSDQFSDSYQIEGEKFELPVDDLEFLYDLQAWLFPQNYSGSELKNKKVVMDDDGHMELIDNPK